MKNPHSSADLCAGKGKSRRARNAGRLAHHAILIKALAHPTRLRILHILLNRRACVSELTETVGADMSTVSRHLSVLRQTGLTTSVKSGTHIRYALAGSEVFRLIRRTDLVCECIRGDSPENEAETSIEPRNTQNRAARDV